MKSIRLFRRAALVAFASTFVLQPLLHATDRTWLGAGANENWSTAENWDGIPVDGDNLIFSGINRLVNTNDLTLVTNLSLRFDSDGFVLNGNPLTLVSGITNAVGTNTINLNLPWTNSARFFNVAPGTELIIAGTNSLSAGDHTYLGGGRIRLKGTHLQLVNPPAFILNNAEYVNDGGVFTNGGGVRITSGTTPSASKLVLTNGAVMSQIIQAGAIRVGDSTNGVNGTLDMSNSKLSLVSNIIHIPFVANGNGSVIQRGGTNTGGVVNFIHAANGTGSYDMIGGVLETYQIKKENASGTATISFDGSTVRALVGEQTAFFTGLTTAEIKAGGVTFDSNGESFTVGQALTGVGRLTKIGSGTITFNGASTFTGGLYASGGTVTLNTANTFSGGVTLTSGTLQVGNDAALGTGTLSLNAGTMRANNATPRTLANPVTLAGNVSFSANGDLTFNGALTLTGSRTLTVNNTNVFNGAVGESGGSWSLTKSGSGNLVLNSSANNYTGGTTITAGSLILGSSGSLANSSNITVQAGAKFDVSAVSGGFTVASGKSLKGNGTVLGDLNISGTVSPGNSVGSLTNTGLVTINTGATYLWNINNAGAGQLVANILSIAGTGLTLDITALESLTNWNTYSSTNWVIAHTTGGGITGFDAAKFTIVDHFSASNSIASGTFSITSDGTDLVLNFTAGVNNVPHQFAATSAGGGSFYGAPSTTYTVQYTTTLSPVSWQTLMQVTTDATGFASFQDPAPAVAPQRYYRIVYP